MKIRFILVFILAATVGSSTAFASDTKRFLVVSDFDDTVKISDSANYLDTAFRGLFTSAVYAGTAEEYSALSERGGITIVSASPTFLYKKISKILNRQGFPERQLVLRSWFKEKTANYKTRVLEDLAASTDLPFVLFGDDTEHDPEIFADFEKRHPGKSAAIFIHRVKGRAIPANMHSFYTAFEAAYAEVSLGFISAESAIAVANAVIESDLKYVVPSFAHCPSRQELRAATENETVSDDELNMYRHGIIERIGGYCEVGTVEQNEK